MKETWKDIKNTDGMYQVSNLGRVRSWKNGKWGRRQTPRILRLGYDRSGYPRQSLNHNGECWNISIHREVAKAFIPNPENKPQVNHLDGNKKNNYVLNLEWATQSENMIHGNEAGLFNHKKGDERHNAVLDKQKARSIRFQYAVQDITQRDLAKIRGVSQKTISNIVNYASY